MELSNNEKEFLRERLAIVKENLKILDDEESELSKSLHKIRELREMIRTTEKALKAFVLTMEGGKDLLANWEEKTPGPVSSPALAVNVDDDDLPF